MSEMSLSDARARLADVVDQARIEDLVVLQAAAAARDEMRETGEAPIPWEQVKADLGIA